MTVTAIRAKKPAKDAVFKPKSGRKSRKSARKAVRKSLVRAAVKNTVADKRLAFHERAAFFKRLRELKMRRRGIAEEMRLLTILVRSLQREVEHVGNRYPAVPSGTVIEAALLVKNARASIEHAADEMYTFSRKKVYFTEVATS